MVVGIDCSRNNLDDLDPRIRDSRRMPQVYCTWQTHSFLCHVYELGKTALNFDANYRVRKLSGGRQAVPANKFST